MRLLLVQLYLMSPPPKFGAAAVEKVCEGCDSPCVGDDEGPCCASYVSFVNKTYCAPYCLVKDYKCCGCVVTNVTNDIFQCFSCPVEQECVEANGGWPNLPGDQKAWYCASGTSLAPHHLMLITFILALLICVLERASF